MNNNKNLETIWRRFISQYNLGTNHIPLFETDNNLNVETKCIKEGIHGVDTIIDQKFNCE